MLFVGTRRETRFQANTPADVQLLRPDFPHLMHHAVYEREPALCRLHLPRSQIHRVFLKLSCWCIRVVFHDGRRPFSKLVPDHPAHVRRPTGLFPDRTLHLPAATLTNACLVRKRVDERWIYSP